MLQQTTNKLSEAQITELRRAFSIFDVGGTGVITAKDLKEVVRGFLDEEITHEEWKQVLLTVDKNGDGKIEWNEFLDVMAEWLGEDLRPEQVKRRRLTTEQERHELHRKIKGFFSQFRKSNDFNEVRQKLQRHGSFLNLANESNQMQLSDDRVTTSQGKFRSNFTLYPRAVEAIFTDSYDRRLEGATYFDELLSIVQVFPTPMERRAIADEIVHLFEAMVQNNLHKRLVELTTFEFNPILQSKALSALINFSAGPRIASTPESSFLHPNKFYFKQLVMKQNLVPCCVRLLETPQQPAVVELVVVLLGTLAAYNPECRDELLHMGVLQPMLRLVSSEAPIPLLKVLSWTLSIFSGVTHPLSALPKYSVVQCALGPLAYMLFCNNEDIVRNVLMSLALILPGRSPDISIAKRFVQLLDADSPSVVKMTLQTLTDLVSLDQQQTLMLMQCGLFPKLKVLLTSKEKDTRIAACDIISQLASTRGQIQSLIDNGIIEDVLKLVGFDENVRWKLIKIVKYVTRGTPSQVKFLVDHGAIHTLCKALADFRSFDRVLTEAYKFVGPTYNFELLVDVLTSLSNMVNIGQMEAEDCGGLNQYALSFDMDAIDKIKHLLDDIIGGIGPDGASTINAWRLHTGDDNEKPELRIKSLIQKIKTALEHHPSKSKAQEHLLRALTNIWNQFFSDPILTQTTNVMGTSNQLDTNPPQPLIETPNPQPTVIPTGAPPAITETLTGTVGPDPARAGELLLLKCFLEDDIRVLEVTHGITFKELKALIERKYKKTVKIQYQDSEGDFVTLDSSKSLARAIRSFESSNLATSMKLKIVEAPAAITSTITNTSSLPSSADSLSSSDPGPHFDLTGATSRNLNATEGRGVKRPHETASHDVQSSLLASLGPVPETPLFSLSKDLEFLKNEQRKQMFHDLEQTTHFGHKELEDLHNWVKSQNPSAIVDRDAFTKALQAINISDSLLIEQYFSAFDVDKNGSIDFREFACGLSIVLKGTPDERLQLMFNSYDLNGDGVLDQAEVFNMFKSTTKSHGKNADDAEINQMVKEVFESVDPEKKDQISWEEFHSAVYSGKLSFSLLATNSTNQ